MKIKWSKKKPVIGCKELRTPKNSVILEDPPTSTDKDMVDLPRYPSGIAIPSLALQRWSLIPGAGNSHPFGSFKIQKESDGGKPERLKRGRGQESKSSCSAHKQNIQLWNKNEDKLSQMVREKKGATVCCLVYLWFGEKRR